ncbi:MAG: 50S ribosomal protein L10 [Crenarchaeota archaeon]|nr:50S ribosomal protein L10 [Thermoproteota archaeon]MDA1124064.1 50S ribosomal protein L10 [Thermoproteota archaeon]
MHENRTTYPKKKVQMYQHLQELPKKYSVLALVRLEKVRGTQLLPLRKKLQGEVEIVSIKDKVAKLAFAKVGITGIDKLSEKVKGQCVLMFTNMSPFKLNVLLGKNKVMLFARGGDIASTDVVIPPKNTGIAPGPMLTDFKENGIATKIDQGTIWIMKETVPVKKGGQISEKLAGLLSKLNIKTIEAGIVLNAALEKGIVYQQEEMIIDVEKFRNDLAQAHQQAISLSIEAAYITADNIEQILSKAAQSAHSVSTETGYLTKDTKEQVLQKAHGQAQSVASKAKDYSPA